VATTFAQYQPGLSATPHIITVATGANDGDDDATALDFAALVDLAVASYPRAAIFAATRTPLYGSGGTVIGSIHRTKVLSEMALRKANGMHITVVDQWTAVGRADMPDGQHPSAQGYVKLGHLWSSAIVALANGLAAA
jgi:hypothetical protein